MNSTHRTRGFSIIEGVIIVVVIGVIAALGLTFYNVAINKTASDTATSSTAESINATPVPEVNSTDDLDKATSDLDSLDTTDSEDATLLDEQDAAF